MKVITATQARKDLYNIVDEAITSSEPIQIQGKRGGVILISVDDWSAIQETIYLNSLKGFTESLKKADDEAWIAEDKVDW